MSDQGRLLLRSDQKIIIGRPAVKVADKIIDELRRIALHTPGCLEAHLPQVFVLGAMAAPRIALAVVIDATQDPEQITLHLNREMAERLSDASIDSWILAPTDSMLPAVRSAQCAIF